MYVCLQHLLLSLISAIITTDATTLKVLNVGFNEIGDDGVAMISGELQHKNSLIELSVAGCGILTQGKELIKLLLP